MFKIRWSESEFVTIFLATGLLVIKAGFIVIFGISFVLVLYQRGMVHGLSLPIIIPSLPGNGIPFAQNGNNWSEPAAGWKIPLFELSTPIPGITPPNDPPQATAQPETILSPSPPASDLSPLGAPQPAEATQVIPQETPLETPTTPPTAETLPTETPAMPVTETPTLFVPVELGTPLPLLPWVQTLDKMCSPIESVRLEELASIVSSPYKPPPAGSDARHMGVDFVFFRRNGQETIDGQPVYALLPGKVVSVVNDRIPYGNLVVIETRYSDVARNLADALGITQDRSLYHLYGHMKFAPPVVLGQRIPCGFQIGNVGNSGTQVPHLHMETRWGPVGGWFPSMAFLGNDTSEEEKANYLYWRISGVYQHFDPLELITTYLNYIKQTK